MKSPLKIAKGKEDIIKLIELELEGEDPTFHAGESHAATLAVQNAGAAPFSYSAQLYLGTAPGDKKISLAAVGFSVAAGGTANVSLGTLVVPKVFAEAVGAPSVGYHTYVDLLFGGAVVATFTAAAADVTIITVLAITITGITWA